MVLEKTLESPLDCKEIQPVHSEGSRRTGWDQRKVRRSVGFKPSWHHVEHTRERAGIRFIDSGLSGYLIVDYQSYQRRLAIDIGEESRDAI